MFGGNPAISIKEFDLDRTTDIETQLCNDIDHVIWCAAGSVQVQQPQGPLDKFLDMFRGNKEAIDISAVREICRVMSEKKKNSK